MDIEKQRERKIRARKMLTVLRRIFPDAKCALFYSTPFELLIAVMLSAQCTDKKVNEVTTKLFKKFRSLSDYALAQSAQFEKDIQPTGFYRNKAKHILKTARVIKKKFHGEVPDKMADLLTLPGVARKTANVVLGNAYGIVEGIAVDTHVLRLSQRLRLMDPKQVGPGKKPLVIPASHVIPANHVIPAKAGIYTNNLNSFQIKSGMTVDYYKDASPEKIELALMKIIPKEDWFRVTYWLIDHGRAICKAQKPDCQNCPLQKL